jgi:hydroxymethylbilane synthase
VLAARPDLVIVPIRGNVGTRLEKLARGEADALVLAAAGLARLGIAPDDATPLPVEVSTPAPGQGLLALQGRDADLETAAAVAALDDGAAHACLRAERALLAALGGGCLQPVGAYCAPQTDGLKMIAFAGSEDGTRAERVVREGPRDAPEALGREAAAALVAVRA